MASRNSVRRNSLEIIASILDACHYWTKRTRVMGQCNMSSKQLEGYLGVLSKANLLLIESDSRSVLFRVSDKGKDFLKAYNNMKTMMESQATEKAVYF